MNASGIHKQKKRSYLGVYLACSLLLNIAGAATGVALFLKPKPNSPVLDVPLSASDHKASKTNPTNPDPSLVKKFHWSDVESEDYSVFISRLRDVGCPESTIRDIVKGEMTANSASKRKQLEQQILHSSGWAPPVGMTRQSFLAAQYRKLDKEVETMTNAVIGSVSSSHSNEGATTNSTPQQSARYPMVLGGINFQPTPQPNSNGTTTPNSATSSRLGGAPAYVSPGVISATPEQIASIKEIQQKFVSDVGGPYQDPTDPQYEEKWNSAQWVSDQIFKARFGWAAYNDIVRATVMKAHEESLKTKPSAN